jgi:ABC-type branched-subunit amino acid transport system substrate-binding protein
MKSVIQTAALCMMVIMVNLSPVTGQNYVEKNYGNIPDTYVAYDNYQKAYKYHFLTPIGFYGAGREIPAPAGLKEVRIGFLGPLEGSNIKEYGTQMLQGATLAIEEANKKGGYKGIPFKMMVHNDVGLWGAAANEVVKMDDEGVWCWLGSIDDIVSHVAIRATLKLEIPMVCTGDPDPTFTETNIPWVVRVIPDDRQSCYALANYVLDIDKHSRVAVIRVNNRYGRVGVVHFNKTATRLGKPIVIEERFKDGESDFSEQLKRIKNTKADAILIWGNPRESGLILKAARAMGLNQPVYCSDRIVNPEFLKIAGNLADGIVTTCQYNPDSKDPKLTAFRASYKKRFGMEPDVFAIHAYDGMNVIIKSIEKAGLNRVLIRDVLTDLKTFQGYEGVSGKLIFDKTWNNVRPIYLAKIKGGKFEFSPAPQYKRVIQ